MSPDGSTALSIPADLVARIRAVAEEQDRPVPDVLYDAMALYSREDHPRREGARSGRSPAEAAARMRQARTGNVLPGDVSLRDLMTHGRA